MYRRFYWLGLAASIAACGEAEKAEVGATLNDKVAVALADVPPEVMAAAKAARGDLRFEKAERVNRNGTVYFDIEGEDASGNDVELDLLRADDGAWQVVEVQRDIDWGTTPEPVRAALRAHDQSINPARIIESDQGGGLIIYEFFTQNADGEEKYEVKFARGQAEFLTQEWAH